MSLSAAVRHPIRNAIRAATVAAIAATVLAFSGRAQAVTISMQALTSFGSSGWLQPSAFPGDASVVSTGTGDRIRSIAFNPVSGNLLYASGTSLYSLNASSGSGFTQLSNSGVSGGSASGGITRVLGTVAVTGDGVIYGSNLSTNSTTTAYKVYRWANESATPSAHYSGNAGLAGARVGDNLAANGSDGTGLLAAGFSNSPSVSGNNSFTTVTTGNSGGTAAAVAYTGGAAGDYRLGISFADADTVLGAQGGSSSSRVREVSFLGTSGTLDFSIALNAPSTERGLLYFSAYGTPLLATQEWGSGSTINTVRLYNASNLLATGAVSFIQSINLTTGTNTNANAIGGLAFGTVNGTPTLYALATNNGIQAIQVVPEPSTTLAAGVCTVGLAGLMLRGRRREQDA
jgi:hypothetical protein